VKKLLLTLVVSGSLIFLGCVGLAEATSISRLGDIRFATDAEPAVGLTLGKVVDKYGPAHEVIKEACAMPLFEDDKQVGIVLGTQLLYSHSQNNMYVSRNMCLVEGVVVGDALVLITREGDKVSSHTLETVDPSLAAELVIRGNEDKQKSDLLRDYNDPRIPKGPEIEI